MRRRAQLRGFSALAVFAGALVPAGLAAASPPRHRAAGDRPDIVLIRADDRRFDSLRALPAVRRLLAARGVTFRNAFVTTSECCPSRASILTGRYSHETGVLGNFGPSSYPQFDERSNLAVWLHDAGYETALVGKYLNGTTSSRS